MSKKKYLQNQISCFDVALAQNIELDLKLHKISPQKVMQIHGTNKLTSLGANISKNASLCLPVICSPKHHSLKPKRTSSGKA